MATTIEVLGIDLEPALLVGAAAAVAAQFGFVASVAVDPVISVRFERGGSGAR
jgi:hypothetical protein